MKFDSQTQSVLTVTQLTQSIKAILEGQYRFIRISGEISNLKTPFSGHSYFSLKDSQSQIRAVLFKNQKRYLAQKLVDGQQVICFGRISVYEPRGDYQLIIDSVEQSGKGNLQLEFEKLKEKLAGQGLFSADHKKGIPQFPTKIVIISSPTGAALQDFLKISALRESQAHFQILPVRVQGKQAAYEIASAIQVANSLESIDIIVLCRGGGSIEDLWAFNEEKVARAIFSSKVPIVTGIGHEIDFTIADFCADFRCPTPTGAAEKIIPDFSDTKTHIEKLKNTLIRNILRKTESLHLTLQNQTRILADFDRIFDNMDLRLNLSKNYLLQEIETNLAAKENRFSLVLQKFESASPRSKLDLQEQTLKLALSQLVHSIQTKMSEKESDFSNIATLLNSVSPLATLARGYSIVSGIDEKTGKSQIITNSHSTEKGADLKILLHRGELSCKVSSIIR